MKEDVFNSHHLTVNETEAMFSQIGRCGNIIIVLLVCVCMRLGSTWQYDFDQNVSLHNT